MIRQGRNADMNAILASDFVRSATRSRSFGRMTSLYLSQIGLVAYWPMSVVETGSLASYASDLSGNDLRLTISSVTFDAYLFPFSSYVSASSARLHRNTETALEITGVDASYMDIGGLTLGCWVRFDNAAGSTEMIMGRRGSSGNLSYWLNRTSGGNIAFGVSSDGTATKIATSTDTVAQNTWAFVLGRFDPSTTVDVFVNSAEDSNTSSVPASVHVGTSSFNIGSTGVPDTYLDGDVSNAFLCTSYLPDPNVIVLYEHTRALYE